MAELRVVGWGEPESAMALKDSGAARCSMRMREERHAEDIQQLIPSRDDCMIA